MSDQFPYLGPVEALTIELAASRCHMSADAFREHYDGPVAYLGNNRSLPRYPAYAVHDWLVRQSQAMRPQAVGSKWDRFGSDEEGNSQRPKGIRTRQEREAS